MAVIYHECCAKPDQPFEYREGLLIRPSDFSITRVVMENGGENFWWNLMNSPRAAEFNPTAMLQKHLAEWKTPRPPFVTSLIHENNFVRSGPEGWTSIYYTPDKRPLSPPFDLNAPDPSQLRSAENQAAIWAAYEQLVAYAAANLRVVTSEDIVAIAKTEATVRSRFVAPFASSRSVFSPPRREERKVSQSILTDPISSCTIFNDSGNHRLTEEAR
jgi:hypothetical protein